MLPWTYRLYFWGVHGVFAEVVFTGVWEFVVSGKWNLMGVSSIWSFLIYGFGTFMAELLRSLLISSEVPLLARCFLYMLSAYAWEFGWGLLLEYYGARSWDYTEFEYDLMGLITLEYAPVWFLGGLCFEAFMFAMEKVERIPRWSPKLRHKIG